MTGEGELPMTKTQKSRYLILYALCIPPLMIAVFAAASRLCGKTVGYFLPYGVYLALLLFGTIKFRREGATAHDGRHQAAYGCLCFIPVIATFLVAFLPTLPHISIRLLLILTLYAGLNGTLEELFWRGTFHGVYGDDLIRAYLLPTAIFTCWHFALLFADGVAYHGGAAALVGGACVMGVIWGFAVYKTGKVWLTVTAHVLVNFFAFSQLLYENWFC
jgi:membrane protease YdiL (CAAX protease family)